MSPVCSCRLVRPSPSGSPLAPLTPVPSLLGSAVGRFPAIVEPVGVAVGERPPDGRQRVGPELRVVPGLRPMAEVGVEHAGRRRAGASRPAAGRCHRAAGSSACGSGPRGRRGGLIETHQDALVAPREPRDRLPFRAPEQVELLGERERIAETLHRHVARILDPDCPWLVLAAMVDEAPADERPVLRPRIEAVGRAVEADEALAAGDEVEHCLPQRSGRGEVAAGEEHEGVGTGRGTRRSSRRDW